MHSTSDLDGDEGGGGGGDDDDGDGDIPETIVKRWLENYGGKLQPDTYWLTRIVLLRAVAFILCKSDLGC